MASSSTEGVRRYRARIRQQGVTEILLRLPVETVEAIDRLREMRGAANRSAAVALLIHRALEAESELKTA